MKLSCSFYCLFLTALNLFVLSSHFAEAQDVSGDWTGSSVVSGGGGVYPNFFTLKQSGTVVNGTSFVNSGTSSYTCQYTGSLIGSTLTLHAECPTVNYSSNSTATTDGLTMSGTFLDSQSTTGTFSATKGATTIAPGVSITYPPQVTVKGTSARFQLQKFSKISLTKIKSLQKRAAAKPKLTLEYELTIAGAEKRKLTSKKNVLTAKNLKPGNYNSKYKATVFKDGKKAFSTKPSDVSAFTVVH